MSEKIKAGDYALLYLDDKRKWLVKVEEGKEFHTHKGIVNLSEAIDKLWGSTIESTMGVKFVLLRPALSDIVVNVARNTNIIYPKDAGLILLHTQIGPGSLVVESGTGSGAFTTVLAYHVRPTGHVYTYEIRKEFIKTARKNIERLGLSEFVTFKNMDICKGIEEENIDAVVLDMATPWKVVEHAYKALKSGGFFVSYSPTIEQVMRTVIALKKSNGFADLKTIEVFVRDILVRSNKTRPSTRMIGHTGYLTFAKKKIREIL